VAFFKQVREEFAELPKRRRLRVRLRLEILAAAALLAYVFAVLVQEQHYGWAVLPAIGLALLSVGEFIVADIIVDARFPPETAAFLERLEEKLSSTSTHQEIVDRLEACVQTFVGCDTDRISSTLHLRVELLGSDGPGVSPGLIQLSDYTTAGLGGRRWRVLTPTKGIVGRCLRAKAMSVVNFSSEEDYRRRMVQEFGFTPSEAESHTQSARSYLAYPVVSRSELIGVMYFFSTEPQVFPHAAQETRLQETADVIASLLRAAAIL
jgi:GAF domain